MPEAPAPVETSQAAIDVGHPVEDPPLIHKLEGFGLSGRRRYAAKAFLRLHQHVVGFDEAMRTSWTFSCVGM